MTIKRRQPSGSVALIDAQAAELIDALQAWKFPDSDVEKMTELSQKTNAGTLTADEQEELDNYERVGHLVAIAQSKARLSL